ncbi:nucleoside 2-deoxyribosyltransferase [Yersinia enterocolitica]|nr:nucleoside 2-deoxyribosyltransferase [Yersinia enterocolitica]EKN3994436.1 nucleoside 2-deoxyribosyltransferase [Yersinia enterocolitica]EKN5083409.1 nucleoside 2-deoxyribosyltransferase [Yersinia enterocolitica]EKN6400319.1 nucleoside 2-deoxyribosyltransferase [Yersinia enterocolitica]EKP3833008.1 nucleoside 2-deoxyribosyltransferase [Yersinia enterocolitica]
MSNLNAETHNTITVTGGVYHEYCLHPGYKNLYGSAGRAASALSHLNVPVILHTYADESAELMLRERAYFENFDVCTVKTERSVFFHYDQGLAEPKIYGIPDAPLPTHNISAENVLRYGMLEGTAVVDAEYAVYDPQNVSTPESFHANGSRAKHLALVLNRYEASTLCGGRRDLSAADLAAELYRQGHAQVIIIKQGPAGALVCENGTISTVPAYETDKVFKIGSGDAFAAYFAHAWMIEKISAHEAANKASRATAYYCENNQFPSPQLLAAYHPAPVIPSENFLRGERPSVYLAGPFFSLAQLWLIEQARRNLTDMGLKVFSPYHDVGHGSADDVVEKDLDGIRNAGVVFAVGDGLDAGTLYEVGFARAMDIPVIFYSENESEEDKKMMSGSGCILCNDYVTAIYKTLWVIAQK